MTSENEQGLRSAIRSALLGSQPAQPADEKEAELTEDQKHRAGLRSAIRSAALANQPVEMDELEQAQAEIDRRKESERQSEREREIRKWLKERGLKDTDERVRALMRREEEDDDDG